MVYQFSAEEYRRGIATLKNNKAAGIDDVLVEQLKNRGPKTHKWLLAMLINLEQDPNNIEEIEVHRHIKTRERLCDT